jgi:membrane-associated phospholipid phosphatase
MVPALAATYLTSRLFGKRAFAEATFHVAVSYLVADAIESSLKPMVGRVRPNEGPEPLTFRPFTTNGDFHSFPSAHVVHVASVGAASAFEVDRPWAFALAGAAMLYVGAQRVYRDQHWSSDVVGSAILGTEVAHVVTTKLHHHHLSRHSTASSPSRRGG